MLELSGVSYRYAGYSNEVLHDIDLRLEDNGNVWVLEANPNPQIAKGEDFAASAEKIGLSYETVLQRIINLGLRWQPESFA